MRNFLFVVLVASGCGRAASIEERCMDDCVESQSCVTVPIDCERFCSNSAEVVMGDAACESAAHAFYDCVDEAGGSCDPSVTQVCSAEIAQTMACTSAYCEANPGSDACAFQMKD
jgi:hypothetical protein